MPWEIQHILKGAQVGVFQHELFELRFRKDFQMLECLVLLMDFFNDLQLVCFYFLLFCSWNCQILLISTFINPLIEYQVCIAASLKQSICILVALVIKLSIVIIVMLLLLTSKAFFLQI